MAEPTLTKSQIEVLEAAEQASDGWLVRGACRIWAKAPTAVTALVRKGYLEMHSSQPRARLTAKGRAFIQPRVEGPDA